MTDTEWLACKDPTLILEFLRGRVSDRKLRMFSVTCCRRALPHMHHEGSRALVELVERHLEAEAPATELERAYRSHERWCSDATPEWEYLNGANQAALDTASSDGLLLVDHIALRAAKSIVETLLAPVHEERRRRCEAIASPYREESPWPSQDEIMAYVHQYQASWEPVEQASAEWLVQEQAIQTLLARDIFGNPFRPVAFSPAWRTSTAVALASQMYESRDFSAMPVLADALQDAGCDSADILDHCRDASVPHVRGCWVVDLVLGKE